MAMGEHALIRRHFADLGAPRDDVRLGVGDDAALLAPPPGMDILRATAMAVAGRDYGPEDPPEGVGHRLLAAALTELAEAGAEPAWATLSVCLEAADEAWLDGFGQGLDRLARRHGLRLVGGDTTRGPGLLALHALGLLPADSLPPRGPARGDLVYVSGTLGDGALALLARQGELRLTGPVLRQVTPRLERPEPPVAAGRAARGRAGAVRACGDGLEACLQGLLAPLGLGASLQAEALPLSPALREHLAAAGGWALPLRAPTPDALCVVVPDEAQGDFEAACAAAGAPCAWVGSVDALAGVRCLAADGEAL